MPRKPLIKKLDLYGLIDYGASDPASGDDGELFYNTTTGTLKIYLSGVWTNIGAGGGVAVDNLLLETGDQLLLENSDAVQLEG
jgi:hypothetical protein